MNIQEKGTFKKYFLKIDKGNMFICEINKLNFEYCIPLAALLIS